MHFGAGSHAYRGQQVWRKAMSSLELLVHLGDVAGP
jgi:hypothetical protein